MERRPAAKSRRAPARPGPDAAFERVHAGTLKLFPDLVTTLGGDPDALLREVGLDRSVCVRPAARASLRALIALMEHAAATLGVPDFGMRLARLQGDGKVFGPIGAVMRNAATLGAALDYASGHIQAYCLAAAMPIERDRASGRITVGMDMLLDHVPTWSQSIEQALLLAHYNAVETTGGRARVRQVRFRHHPIAPARSYRAYFGCEVLFDQPADALVFSQADWDAPIAAPDPAQRALASSFIDAYYPAAPAPMRARVRGLVMKSLGVSDCRIDRVAGALCLSPRTLHRRLRGEGKSFEDIKDEVRRDRALYYVERTDLPFTRVAEKLGYSETSVLSRSCLRWFGACPRDLRTRLRSGPNRGGLRHRLDAPARAAPLAERSA